MARELNMTTQKMNFWKESFNKETQFRMAALIARQKEGQTLENLLKRQTEVFQAKTKKARQAIPKVEIAPIKLPEIKPKSAEKKILGENIPTMKNVDSGIQRLLLRGISKHGEGRANYLKVRKSEAPVDKYNFQYCSSWEHGWDIESYRQALNPSKYCRNPIVRTTFYRPNGVRYEELEL